MLTPACWIILGLIVGSALLDALLDLLSLSRLHGPNAELPPEFAEVYDPSAYTQALSYQATNSRFDLISLAIETPLVVVFILCGGFNSVDLWARTQADNPLWVGLVFAGVLALLRTGLQLPFSIYRTFVIEESYGFNRTTPVTFVADLGKSLLIGAVIGGAVFTGVVYFFESMGPMAWLYAWGAFTVFQLVLMYLAPIVLLPLFNRFQPLPPGELRSAIEQYCARNRFRISGISTMDSSRRSAKGNAFFTGFGRFKRLVLFDTLIEKQSTDELVAIFAHEAGHYKLGHIPRFMAVSIASSALLFFVFSLFIGNPAIFEAFRMENVSIYASLVFVGLLYSPVSRVLGVFGHALSRRAEFEADRYSVETFGQPDTMASALKKLSMDNLSSLNPHPLRVFFDYTHPPVLRRIEALRKMAEQPASVVRRIR